MGSALRRDECGAWTITDNHGTIHTWGDGKTWVLYVACRSALHWTYTKRRLSFCAAALVPGGGVKVDLQGRFQSPLVVTIDAANGEVKMQHLGEPPEAHRYAGTSRPNY